MRTPVGCRSEYVFLSVALLFLPFGFQPTAYGQETSSQKYWIYFTDKGLESVGVRSLAKGSQLYEVAEGLLSEKALWRRGKVLKQESLIDLDDVPVYEPYLGELRKLGITPHASSRWFNAVSAYLTPEQRSSVTSLLFVKEVVPVVTLFRERESLERQTENRLSTRPEQHRFLQKVDALNYGPSLEQDSIIKVPAVHALGISGRGVLVGMLDTGFRWKTHEALTNARVIAEYDFIFKDSVTADEANDPIGQDSHGTSTMSTVGGFKEGQLIGPAYGASFILGKTEYVPTETRIEEDNWVAAIEWMESKGVDVVSSSLGYTTFDDGTGYRYSNGDFNGRTAVTTKAAVIAARKGVVVVNSMGNGGNTVGSIIAPADADSMIAVGAVNYSGTLASFSSVGPTNDGRTKPDVVAPGVSIYTASAFGTNQYGRASGTSFSCPLTSGVAALVLSAHPEFTPIQVRDAIRNTASRASRPDNLYGWGIVNAWAAVLSGGLVFSNAPLLYFNGETNIVVTYAASNTGIDNLGIYLLYSLDGGRTFSSLQMVPTTAANQFLVKIPKQPIGTTVYYYIEGTDQGGIQRRSPYDAPSNLFSFRYGEGSTEPIVSTPIPVDIPAGFFLYQNYPNPFNPSTTIQFYAPEFADGEVAVYNTLGEKVRTLFNGRARPGNNFVRWDGRDERGIRVASGVYFYRFRTATYSDTKRMLLIK
jgi:serine protease AprX